MEVPFLINSMVAVVFSPQLQTQNPESSTNTTPRTLHSTPELNSKAFSRSKPEAQAAMLFAAPTSPLAQPRNVFGGLTPNASP